MVCLYIKLNDKINVMLVWRANHKYYKLFSLYTADIDSNFITDECPTILSITPGSEPNRQSTTIITPPVTQKESAVATSTDAIVASSVASVIALILLVTGGILLVIIKLFRKRHVKEDTITR